jgi:hypothetical protein
LCAIEKLESLLATPEVEIDINDQQTYPKQTTVNAGERTSTAFSGQLPRLHLVDSAVFIFCFICLTEYDFCLTAGSRSSSMKGTFSEDSLSVSSSWCKRGS